MSKKIVSPIYHRIALDLATKIVNGIYKPGERIHGRSTLAGHYNVSPETIRRAIFILQDVGIVKIIPSVGIEVISTEKALSFVEKFRDIETLTAKKYETLTLLNELAEINTKLQSSINTLVDQTEQYRSLNPFAPYEIELKKGDNIVGQTISELNFWHNTGVTIIAVKRLDETIISPGPHLEFKVGDILLVVGDEESFGRANRFIKEKNGNK